LQGCYRPAGPVVVSPGKEIEETVDRPSGCSCHPWDSIGQFADTGYLTANTTTTAQSVNDPAVPRAEVTFHEVRQRFRDFGGRYWFIPLTQCPQPRTHRMDQANAHALGKTEPSEAGDHLENNPLNAGNRLPHQGADVQGHHLLIVPTRI